MSSSPVVITKLDIYEGWRLKLRAVADTQPFSVMLLPFREADNWFVQPRMPADGVVVVTMSDGTTLQTNPFKVPTITTAKPKTIPCSEGKILVEYSSAAVAPAYNVAEFDKLSAKGRLPLRVHKKLIGYVQLTKVVPDQVSHDNHGNSYIYRCDGFDVAVS